MMHTEQYCESLSDLDRVQAIRAIHCAWLQLAALSQNADCGDYDNTEALARLAQCLADAGHPAFPQTAERRAYLGLKVEV